MKTKWQQPGLNSLFIKYGEDDLPTGMLRWVDILSELDELEWPRNENEFSYLMWSLHTEPVSFDYVPLPAL